MDTPLQPVDLTSYLAQPNEPQRELLELFRPSERLVIFDIGSCEGEDAIRYSRRFSQARIFAFEPLPANQTLMRANFGRFGVSNIELVPMAISDRIGEAPFHVSSGRPKDLFFGDQWNYGNKSSSLLPPAQTDPMYGWIEFRDTINVPCITLDAFCEQHGIQSVDFIHMDVQGAEHLVLEGAHRILRNTTSLWLEVSDQRLYRGQKLRSEMKIILSKKGFSLGFEVRREIEGDQFYVNRRLPRTWSYLARKRLSRIAKAVQKRLGRRN